MSVSKKSGGGSRKCIPCQPSTKQVYGGISTVGGYGIVGPAAAEALCPGADDDCKESLANAIADAIRNQLPFSPFGETCYECEDLTVTITSAACVDGEFTGNVVVAGAGSFGAVLNACKEIPCGAQPL
jgi:hypothetical protein